MTFTRKLGSRIAQLQNDRNMTPQQPFHALSITLNNGQPFSFAQLAGKKVLLVNTASDCGYTGQYAPLQQLYKEYGDRLVVIGFPSNDFKEQEKGSDAEIAQFCQVNYGVTFPLATKQPVTGADQQTVYQWLTDAAQNGWNTQPPSWNFAKYLVDEAGRLIAYFDPGVDPLSNDVLQHLK